MQIEPLVIGWLVGSALLGAEHVLLFNHPWKVDKPWSYVIGLGTVLLACLVWARAYTGLIAPTDAVIAFGIVSTSGGWVILGYAIRDRIARHRQSMRLAEEARARASELIGE